MRPALRLKAVEAFVPAPAAKACPAERVLSGHSGARVVLHTTVRDSFVRKTAPNASASPRLKAQADKQHSFWMFGLPVPKVRRQSVDPTGIASFDMNYIPGRTIADAVANGGTYDPSTVAKAVSRLMAALTLDGGGKLPIELFERKIRAVANRAAELIVDADLLRTIRDCAQLLLACDWSAIPETSCHGDLTLENILLTSGKSITFIDCDVSFASSYWLDFGKLFQDIHGHWCIRSLYEPGGPTIGRLNASQKLASLGLHLRQLAGELDRNILERLPQLAALGLLRAIPYAKTNIQMQFICDRIMHVMEDRHAKTC